MIRRTQNIDLTVGPLGRCLMYYALPIFASSLFQQLYTTADAIILGQFAGKTGLAAIDAIYNLLKLPVNFFVGLSTGASILISRFFGARDEKSLSNAVHTGICFAFAGGVVLSIAGIVISPLCIKMLEVPDEILNQSLAYTRIIFSGLVLSLVYNLGAGILRAVGDSKTPFYILVFAGAVNIILDLIFVAVCKMNASGAALATIISQGFSAVLVLAKLFRASAPYQIKRHALKIDGKMLFSICRLGLPIGIQSALFPIANMVVQRSINSTGEDNIAAWALCGKLDLLIWLIADSMAAAISTFVAQNHGAKFYERSRRGVRIGLTMTAAAIALFSGILFIWSVPIGKLFIRAEDADVAIAAGNIMRFLAPLYILYALGEILAGAIRGTGDTFRPMLITLIGTCALRILWILLVVPRQGDLFLILSCYPLSWGAITIAFALYYWHCGSTVFRKQKPLQQ